VAFDIITVTIMVEVFAFIEVTVVRVFMAES
jgi:hypothetical protein